MKTVRVGIFAWLMVSATSALGQGAPYAMERYRVTQQGGGLGNTVDEIVIVSLVINDGRRTRWIAEKSRKDHRWCGRQVNGRCVATDQTMHGWIDGDQCPALTAVFVDLSQLKLSGFAPPARSERLALDHNPLLTVTGTPDGVAGYGARMSLEGLTGPLVDWWTASESRLAPCWIDGPLMSSGQILETRLPAR
jgi:hypothetical protein